MASKRTRANKPEMIHCPYCGEDYSSTYKHCPFCDEVEPAEDDYQTDEYDEAPRSRGGKRLVTNTRGGGYGGGTSPLKIIGTVVSLALIVAAVIIVITIIRPLVAKGDVDGPADNTTPVESVTPTPDASPSETEPAGESTPPVAETPGDTIPEGQTATGFTLSKSEFTLSDKWPNPITLTVTFIPDGSAGKITWSSSAAPPSPPPWPAASPRPVWFTTPSPPAHPPPAGAAPAPPAPCPSTGRTSPWRPDRPSR